MLRRKELAASPVRDSIETADAIGALITDSLATAEAIAASTAASTVAAATPVIRMLVAAGHLDTRPLVLVAGQTTCEIGTVSGRRALQHEENLNPIVGLTSASDYMLCLPEGILVPIAQAATDVDRHIAVGSPDPQAALASESSSAGGSPLVDLAALRAAVDKR